MFLVIYSTVAITRHNIFASHAFDLGIFDQAVWNLSKFQAPASTIRGFTNIFGDHFHPIIILAVPLYWLISDVRVLLVLQVALFVLAALPIYWIAYKRFGKFVALLWVCAYLLFWGVQSTVLYDFHEIVFAVPIVSFALYYILDKRFSQSIPFILSLLLVKEDMPFLVIAFGLLMAIYKEWRYAIALLTAGVAWFLLVSKLVLPILSGNTSYYYWRYGELGNNLESSIKTVLLKPWLVVYLFFLPIIKTKTLLLSFLPFLGLAVFSPLVILALPLFAARFLSTEQTYWSTNFHYTAVLAPILISASLDALDRFQKRFSMQKPIIIGISILVLVINIGIMLLPSSDLRQLVTQYTNSESKLVGSTEAFITIPPQASVIAQDVIAPHLTHRDKIYDFSPNGIKHQVDYIIVNPSLPFYPMTPELFTTTINQLPDKGYKIIYDYNNWMVYKRI